MNLKFIFETLIRILWPIFQKNANIYYYPKSKREKQIFCSILAQMILFGPFLYMKTSKDY